MNANERRERDTQIFRHRLRGFSYASLSAAFGLTDRQCRRIVDTERERQAGMFDPTAQERLEDFMDSLDAAAEELALEADAARSSSAKTKAISARVTVLKLQWRLLNEAGLLPRYTPRPLEQGVGFALALTKILQRNNVPPEVIYECMEVVRAWTDDDKPRGARSSDISYA
jgi:hypothetical protein